MTRAALTCACSSNSMATKQCTLKKKKLKKMMHLPTRSMKKTTLIETYIKTKIYILNFLTFKQKQYEKVFFCSY